MAAIPIAGGASYAPRWVMRTLLRVAVLVGLITIGWLLGTGTGHADEDPGLPGTGLVPVVDTVSAHAVTSPAITRALSAVSVPQPPVHPPVKLGILRPIGKAVGLPKPLALAPVSRPLHATALQGTGLHVNETRAPAPVEPLLGMSSAPPTVAVAVPTAAPQTAVLTPAPEHQTTPPLTLCAPARTVADPVTVQPVIVQSAAGHGLPEGPAPVNPPGNDASACLIGSAGGGGGAKGDPELAAQLSSAMAAHAQPAGWAPQEGSDLPRSLSAQPSTSPD